VQFVNSVNVKVQPNALALNLVGTGGQPSPPHDQNANPEASAGVTDVTGCS